MHYIHYCGANMSENESKKAPPGMKVAFDFIKGAAFRSIRADGVVGGLTPNGLFIWLFIARGQLYRVGWCMS